MPELQKHIDAIIELYFNEKDAVKRYEIAAEVQRALDEARQATVRKITKGE